MKSHIRYSLFFIKVKNWPRYYPLTSKGAGGGVLKAKSGELFQAPRL